MKPSRLLLIVAALLASIPLSAQKKHKSEEQDSLVRLLNAASLEVMEQNGKNIRKTIDSKFLHNNTYLISDTAIWNVDDKIINAWGHVKVIQDRTTLTSDKLDYYVDEDMAKFRGTLVQLQDKEKNTLRTHNLDYNTKDSVAVFFDGGSMKDKDGQVMESLSGTYDSKIKTFTFSENVNMFTDSIFIKTGRLSYDSGTSTATFHRFIDIWKDKNMLSAKNCRYDRAGEIFYFWDTVHGTSETQETWSDSLHYFRNSNDVKMFGHAQVTDTTRKVNALAEYIFYEDSLSRLTMERDATIIARTEENDKVDSVFFGADKMIYFTLRRCDVDSLEAKLAETRLADMSTDPVRAYRRKAAEAAAKAAADASKDDPNKPKVQQGEQQKQASKKSSGKKKKKKKDKKGDVVDSLKIDKGEFTGADVSGTEQDNGSTGTEQIDSTGVKSGVKDSLKTGSDSLKMGNDSLKTGSDSLKMGNDSLKTGNDSLKAGSDSLKAGKDSLAAGPLDTTKVGFLTALGKVRLFRSDMQVRCDSLVYTDLDSLARLYKEPLVWNEGNRQYTSDSLTVMIHNGRMEKASLSSNAFVTIQEDSTLFDQIRATEILAYFDTTSALERFDALGGATAMFFLQENDVYATVNKVDSKMLSATFKNANIERVYYYDSPKNDAYPVVQLPESEKQMKGFNWQPEKRPKSRYDITSLQLRKSQRDEYAKRPKTDFKQTALYFPGYMDKVLKDIAKRDSLKARREREAEYRRQHPELFENKDTTQAGDSLKTGLDSLKAGNVSLKTGLDSLKAGTDSLKAGTDSLKTGEGVPGEGISIQIDSLRQSADSLGAQTALEGTEPAAAEQKTGKQKADKPKKVKEPKPEVDREALREQKQAAREARWAELDARDAAKAEKKRLKDLEKERLRKQKALIKAAKREAKEQKILERYVAKYRKQKEAAEKKAPKK